MNKTTLAIIPALLGLFSQCQPSSTATLEVETLPSPAPLHSSLPHLSTTDDDRVVLSWVTEQDSLAKLGFATYSEGAWTAPIAVSQGYNWFVNWADFPSVMANGQQVAAHWLQMRAEGTYDYDVYLSLSGDSGATWDTTFIPHTDGVAAEHGFVSMLPTDKGWFATWLDGRNTKTPLEEHDATQHTDHDHVQGGPMTIRAGTFGYDGTETEGWELDARVCDCCQTSAALTSQGPIVVYRDRSADEVRDMSIVRLVEGSWTAPATIHADGWKIAGCPVNGPAVDALGNQVAVAWFTAANGQAKVNLAFSSNAGATFESPTTVSSEGAIGRVGVNMLPNANAVITWVESTETGGQVMLAIYQPDGTQVDRTVISDFETARSGGFPMITNTQEHIYLAWTDTDASIIKVARLEIPDLVE